MGLKAFTYLTYNRKHRVPKYKRNYILHLKLRKQNLCYILRKKCVHYVNGCYIIKENLILNSALLTIG